MKKLLYTLLVVATLVGLSSTALAANGATAVAFNDIAGHEAESELTLMGALGVFAGEAGLGGAAKPDDPITRAQFCKVVVSAIGKGSTAAGLAGLQPTFTDGASIPTWAWGFVNVASYMGIINGYADGSFGPNNPVTYAEAVTMLIRAIPGHVAQVPAGVWPYNYMFYGVDAGFTGSVDVGFASLPCTRGDMARLLFATMQVNQLFTTGDNAGKEKPDTAILVEGVNMFHDTLNDYDPDDGDVYLSWEGWMDPADTVYLAGAKSYDDLLNLGVLAVTKDDKLVFVGKDVDTTVVKGVLDTIEEDDAGNWFVVLADGTKVPFEEGACTFYSFPVDLNQDNGADDSDLLAGDELVINVYDSGLVASVTATRWDLVTWDNGWDDEAEAYYSVYGWDYVQSVDKSTDEEDTVVTFSEGSPFFYWDDGTWPFSHSHTLANAAIPIPSYAKVTLNGALADRDDLKPGDVLKIATYGAYGFGDEPDDIRLVSATRKTVEGTITASRNVFPGDIQYVTLKSGDTSKEYKFNEYAYGVGGLAGKHLYSLGEDGNLFFDAEYTDATPIVYVTGARTETGEETHYFITGDLRGEEVTYEVPGDSNGMVDHFIALTINGATGIVEGASDVCPWAEGCVVDAASADNVTFTLGGSTYFIEDVPVYKVVDGEVTYIGSAALAPDNEFWAYYDIFGTPADTTVIIVDSDDVWHDWMD